MMRSMFSGVTGLRNHQTRMDAIGNNIANVNTIGYKASRVSFQDTLNQTLRGASAPNNNRGGINALQIGLGMNLASIDILQTQGNLQNTGKITDCAIQGDGFFILSDGNKQYYTRAGNFNMERDGRLVNSSNGLNVMGWMADSNGVINTSIPITNIRIPIGQTIAPIATTKIEFGGNLAANTNVHLQYMTQSITDASGNHSATITYKLKQVGFNEYEYEAVVEGGSITGGTGYKGILRLNENGVVISNTPGGWFEVTPTNGTAVRITGPEVGRLMGDSFNAHATGTLQSSVLTGFSGTPGSFDTTLRDANGNTVNLTYEITATSVPNRFQWRIVATDPPNNVTIVEGGIGTFDWDSTRGVYNVSDVTTVVRSTATNAVDITINPPSAMSGPPTFTVVERAPETIPAGTISIDNPAWAGAGDYTYNLTNAAGELLTVLKFNVTEPTAGTYSWTLSVDNGTVLSGGSGTFGGTLSSSDTVIRLDNGVTITLGAMTSAATPATFGECRMVGEEAGQVKITLPRPVMTMTKVYDSLGNEHVLTTTATKVDDNTWIWSTVDEYDNPLAGGRILFSDQGELISYTGGPITFTPPGALPVRINPDFSNLSQYAGTLDSDNMALSDFTSPYQDGYPMGILQGFNIDSSGRIIGVFSNGLTQNLAQLAVASFNNPAGLTRAGDTMFAESSNSGQPQIGQAGQGSRGTISPGTLEMSNVDLSQEFTDLIMTERGFQSNSRVITTTDEMLQELVNLKR